MNLESLELKVKKGSANIKRSFSGKLRTALVLSTMAAFSTATSAHAGEVYSELLRNAGVKPTGLEAVYPDDYSCPQIKGELGNFGVERNFTNYPHLHKGIDLDGRDVIAPADGVIVDVYKVAVSGNVVKILHTPDDLNWNHYGGSAYLHLKEDSIRATVDGIEYVGKELIGLRIERGQKFAEVGNSGSDEYSIGIKHTSTGGHEIIRWKFLPHLHFEAYVGNEKLNFWSGNSHYTNYPRDGKWADPLYMLGLYQTDKLPEDRLHREIKVEIRPYIPGKDYSNFVGFTWPIRCQKK